MSLKTKAIIGKAASEQRVVTQFAMDDGSIKTERRPHNGLRFVAIEVEIELADDQDGRAVVADLFESMQSFARSLK